MKRAYPVRNRRQKKYLAQYAFRTNRIAFYDYHLLLLPLYDKNG